MLGQYLGSQWIKMQHFGGLRLACMKRIALWRQDCGREILTQLHRRYWLYACGKLDIATSPGPRSNFVQTDDDGGTLKK